ncbi:hypothetical protein CYMTET_49978 [Cymbomonas tetramitiformis]|uniref:Major facilitator superfamily (MFS) profile domain-containing protein n=1 Tax=Cymbomonas tetramitiformis TaxID=36881 RepID=A0AAE0BP49_9CHLO|nr:hypothetical protein CYMTET_49978 [Cymbomonas tetramitiformis]
MNWSQLEAPLLTKSEFRSHGAFGALLRSSVAPIVCGFALGAGYGNIGGVMSSDNFKNYYNHPSDPVVELLGAVLQAGCIVGSILAGFLSDRLGRRNGAFNAALLLLLGTLIAGMPLYTDVKSLAPIFVGRAFIGVANGFLSCTIPTYVCEVASATHRGAVNSTFQFFIVLGILISYLLNWALVPSVEIGWKLSLAWQAVPAFGLVIALSFLPESPRWLILFGNDPVAAATALHQFRCKEDDVQEEIRGIVAESQSVQRQATTSTWREVCSEDHRRNVLVAMMIGMMQNGNGIDIMTVYAPSIFSDLSGDESEERKLWNTVLVGITFVLLTPVAVMYVDRFGRKFLLLIGTAGMILSMLTLSVCGHLMKGSYSHGMAHAVLGNVSVAALLAVCAFFSFSWGPVAWIVPSELLPSHLRARVVSFTTVLNWMTDYTVISTWLSLSSAVGEAGGFMVYSIVNVIIFMFVLAFLKETKGTNLEQA